LEEMRSVEVAFAIDQGAFNLYKENIAKMYK
jgi:hypothetical protein